MKKTVLREYAKLIVRVGANVQKGQNVIINAGLDQPEFVKMVVEEAYKAGAANVMVQWSYQPLTKLDVRYKSMKNLSAVLDANGLTFEDAIKTTCFLADMGDFAVFNEVYGKYFTSKPARSCVAVKTLPKNVLCEVEVIALMK